MSTAAPLSHPLPQVPARERTASAHPQSDESRITALEVRWEQTVPTLATIADLRGDLGGLENRFIKWLVSSAGALLLALFGIFFAGYASLNARIDSMVSELRTEFKAELRETRASMEARFEKMDARFEKIDEKFEKIDVRFEKMDEKLEKIDAHFEQMDAKFDALIEELRSQRSDSR